MRIFNSKLTFILIMTLFHFTLALSQKNNQKPNIILIIADDLGWRDIGPYGATDVKTPNIDNLANQGMTFDSMYTSTAMCSPSRQQILTGMFPVRNGGYPNHSWVYEGVKSMPHHLGQVGYRVGMSGKRHFGPADSFPFDYIGDSEQLTSDEMKSIEEYISKDNSQPFAMYIALHESHKPWTKGSKEKYDPNQLTIPLYLVDTQQTREELQNYYAEVTYLDKQIGDILLMLEKHQLEKNTIVIFTTEQGPQFPFAKWTCYENGLKTGFIVKWPGIVPKKSRNDALVQYVDVIPTLIDIAGGNLTDINTGKKDINNETGFDGKSFLPLLLGTEKQFRKYVYGVHTTIGIINSSDFYPIRSISDGRYKLIKNLNYTAKFSNLSNPADPMLFPNPEKKPIMDTALTTSWFEAGKENKDIEKRIRSYYKRPPIEFYDLKKDPFELNNLANKTDYLSKIEELDIKLSEWMIQQNDKGLKTEIDAMSRSGHLIRKQKNID